MGDLGKQLEKAAVEAFKQQVTQAVGRLRCRTHGKVASVRFPSATTLRDLERGLSVEGICCDQFKSEVQKALGGK